MIRSALEVHSLTNDCVELLKKTEAAVHRFGHKRQCDDKNRIENFVQKL